MNATERKGLEARLTTLLHDDEVAAVPPDALESALARVAATGQRPRPFWMPNTRIIRRGRSARRFGFVAVAAALTLVAGLIGSGGGGPVDHSAVQVPAPTATPSLSISATMDLQFHPYTVEVGLGRVWVGGPIDQYKPAGVLVRVDKTSNELTRMPIEVQGCSSSFSDWSRPSIAFGSLWIADCGGDRILRVSPDAGKIEATFPGFVSPWDVPQDHLVAHDNDAVYIVRDTRVSAIDRVDVGTNVATPFLTVGDPTLDITIDGRTLWVTTQSSISKYDLATRARLGTFALAPLTSMERHVSAIPVDHGLWVNTGDAVIVAVDGASRRTTFGVGGPLRRFAFANGKIWTIRDVFTLVSIDPLQRLVVDALPIADGQGGLAADGDTLWFAEFEGQRLVRAIAP